MMSDSEKAKIWAMIKARMAERKAMAEEAEKARLMNRVIVWVKGEKK